MISLKELMMREEYSWCSYIKIEIDKAFDKKEAIKAFKIKEAIKDKFFAVFYICLYFYYKKENQMISKVFETEVFESKELLEKFHFPFFWLNNRSKKDSISMIEQKYHNHIKEHLLSTKDSMIDYIDSPPDEKKYKKNFMKALKLKGEENRRIVFKEMRGKYGIIVGVNDKTTNNKILSNRKKLESLYQLCEQAMASDLNDLETIDEWLGYASINGYNKPPYYEEFKIADNEILECLMFD